VSETGSDSLTDKHHATLQHSRMAFD